MISQTPASFMRRFPALLISIFAGVALLLASIGIYGVVSYSVSQQTHYIGVRMALGARPSDILRMVLKQGLVLALLGLGIGVVGAWIDACAKKSSLLFEVSSYDLATFRSLQERCSWSHCSRVICRRDARQKSIPWLHCVTSKVLPIGIAMPI